MLFVFAAVTFWKDRTIDMMKHYQLTSAIYDILGVQSLVVV